MNINLPKASVGLGTSGIGDNFARTRLLMAKQAGYVQNTPPPYSQPGTALKQYQGVAPLLSAVAAAQGQKGIPGLLRQGMAGRPPMQLQQQGGMSSLASTPSPNFTSAMAAHAGGNPFMAMGQQQGGQPGGPQVPPITSPMPPVGGVHGVPPGQAPNPGNGYGGLYPPGTIGNFRPMFGMMGGR